MKTTDDVMLKLLCDKSPIERELYILGVLMYWLEREIVHNNYVMPNSETFSKYIKNADDILESLVRLYNEKQLHENPNVTREQIVLFNNDYDIIQYCLVYCELKGRMNLNGPLGYRKKFSDITIKEIWGKIKTWLKKKIS
jgi:hypothetical protein